MDNVAQFMTKSNTKSQDAASDSGNTNWQFQHFSSENIVILNPKDLYNCCKYLLDPDTMLQY